MIVAARWFCSDKIKQQTKYKYGDTMKTKEKPNWKASYLF
jgi:hypothetical protein